MFNWFRRQPATASATAAPAAAAPAATTAADMLRGLWIDEPDAHEVLARRAMDETLRDDLRQFIDQGYVIVRGAVSPALADQVVAEAHQVFTEPAHYVMRERGAYADPATLGGELGLGHRLIDLYAVSPAAREAAFSPRVAALLQAAFGEPAIAIQSLYFEYGSQQAIHQDTAYVVSRRPMGLAAIWVALEDVAPGTGELCYYPGGHRFPHFLFGGERKHWIQNKDGQEQHHAFFKHLHDQAKARGIALETFLPRKGDVLIWHADLPHGGCKIEHMRTRRSLVLHYAPRSVKANYMDRIGADYHELPGAGGNFFSCRHYRLQDMDTRGRAQLLFDGGVSQRRAGAAR